MSHHDSKVLDVATTVAIAINVGSAVWGFADEGHHELAEQVETMTLAFFVVELGLRLKMTGVKEFFSDHWNLIDSVVIVLSLLPVLADGLAAVRLVRVAKMVHMMRHLAHLRLISRYQMWQFKRGFTYTGEAVAAW